MGRGNACMGGVLFVIARCDFSFLCSGNRNVPSKAVDIFNAITGNWSTAVLSEARFGLAATSLPNQGLAIFAGGQGMLCDCNCDNCGDAFVVWGWGFDACFGEVVCRARCYSPHIIFAVDNGGAFNAVDIFNAITGIWSTNHLNEARSSLAATSLLNQGLALFAGGEGTSFDCYRDDCNDACGVWRMWGGM